MASSIQSTQPRLRASCDGCFIAKVKCSKARPICTRCLACGIECRYSPSSRAGKPKADNSSNNNHRPSSEVCMADMSPGSDDKHMLYSGHPLYRLETGWNTPPSSVDGSLSRNQSIPSGLALMGVDTTGPDALMMGGDMYGAVMPWTPPSDMAAQFTDATAFVGPMAPGDVRSQSYEVSMPAMTWVDPAAPEMFAYNHSQLPTPNSFSNSTYFPSPTTTPTLRAVPRNHSPHKAATGPMSGSSGSGNDNTAIAACACFTSCLQSLQALHNASASPPPPFDLVMSLNRKAVNGCASMLNCSCCMSRSGNHTIAMLLATVIGKITSFYKSACQGYFDGAQNPIAHKANNMLDASNAIPGLMHHDDHHQQQQQQRLSVPKTQMPGPNTAGSQHRHNHIGAIMTPPVGGSGLGIDLSAYQVNGKDKQWLELEILARELHRLEEVYARFAELVSAWSSPGEGPELWGKAVVEWLGCELYSVMRMIQCRNGGIGFVPC